MSRPKRLFTGLLVAALLGAAAAASYWAQARQVATLGRITALENRLIISNEQRARAAKSTVAGVDEEVRKKHSPAADMAVLRQTQQIQDSTEMLLTQLHQRRQAWQAPDSEPNIDPLPGRVERYLSFVRQFVPEAPSLTKPSAQTAAVGWLGEFNMADEPRPAALAFLTRLETQIRQIEAEALTNQATKVVFEGVFDKVGAFALSTSENVTPGAIYQGQLLLASTTATSRAQFSANGHELPIAPDFRHAAVQFKIPAARPGQPDTVRAAWHGRIQLPWAASDTVLETTVPYLIVKPRPR
jgi:hypothetical protein